jgi:hypothetical protein
MKTAITFEIDTAKLGSVTDAYLVQLWHIAQANPAPITDPAAGELAEHIGREIIRRFVQQTGPELWNHQGRHHYLLTLSEHGRWVDGVWQSGKEDAA